MTKKVGDYLIPFHPVTGDLMHYPQSYYVGEYPNGKLTEPDWRQNYKFESFLYFKGFSRGRSAAYANFVDDNGVRHTMFLSDLEDLIKSRSTFMRGAWHDEWTFCKRGMNYGIRMAP